MLKNYLTIAWRNIVRNKVFSAINIFGLALGMACSLLIVLWVMDERGIDAFHARDNTLYDVYERQYHDGQIDGMPYTPGMLAEEMKIKFPEVEYATSWAWNHLAAFKVNDKILNEEGNFASPDFFVMFSYPLLEGDAARALKAPSSIAISRKMAVDFFGSPENAIGKSILYKNTRDFAVSAVFENTSGRSSRKFDFILPWKAFLDENPWASDWGNSGPETFLGLRADADIRAFRKKIKSFTELYSKQENFRIELDIRKYSDQYLHSHFENGELKGGRIQYVNLFSVVAVFILLIACINFMNLSTARSVKRAREIGVRKVSGALRSSLVKQFIGEALLTVVIAFAISLLITALILPLFNEITDKHVEIPMSSSLFWLYLLVLTIVTGLVSGSYPALYLSSFKPVGVLKGSPNFGTRATWLRKGLVVFQFSLSLILIVGTIVVSRQVNYIQSVNLGYNRSNLIFIPLEGGILEKYTLFKNRALNLPGINSVTRITSNPTSIGTGTGGLQWEGKDPSSKVQFTFADVGYDFTKVMEVSMAAGRDFAKEFASDSTGYILNETASKLMNTKNPIGMPLTMWETKGTVVGIVKDFHFNSLHEQISPLVLRLRDNQKYGSAMVRTEPGKTKEALASLEKLCKELNPQFPFTYKFLDQEYQKLYKSEQVVNSLSTAFAFLGTFISCLGLLGLAMFTVEQRTREIGIRKVLGASAGSLFNLLSSELMMLVGISLLIASPLAWMISKDWLKGYAYHIDVTLWIFIIAGLLTSLVALITISIQTLRAMFTDPVKSLRTE